MIVGGIAWDLIVQSSDLATPGRCVAAHDAHQGLGGKGANQAVAIARLGAPAALIGAIGGDASGEIAMRKLEAEGVSTTAVVRADDAATGMVVIQRDAHANQQTVVHAGANASLSPPVVRSFSDLIARARVVVVQFEVPAESVRCAIDIARQAGATVIVDPSPVRFVNLDVVRAADVLKPNAAEARVLTGVDVHDLPSARAAAERLRATGARAVAIEAGAEGNLFVKGSEEVFLRLHDLQGVDRTGAGDTMTAALAVGIHEGWSWRRTAEFANAAAALATRRIGAQSSMPSRQEVERLRSGLLVHALEQQP